MGNLIERTIVAFGLSLFLFGCGQGLPYKTGDRRGVQKVEVPTLSGRYTDINGEIIDLADLSDSVQVLVFAQDTCSVCSSEARFLVETYKARGAPTTFVLRHLLVGATHADARDWKDFHDVPWSVGYVDSSVFRSYCVEEKVPCVVAFDPKRGQIFNGVGEVEFEKLMEVVGPWKF